MLSNSQIVVHPSMIIYLACVSTIEMTTSWAVWNLYLVKDVGPSRLLNFSVCLCLCIDE